MTKKQSEILLYALLREMRYENDSNKRYDLQVLGEGLLGEYRDLKEKEVAKRLGLDR